MTPRHIVAIGGSDAGISAALRARELDPTTDVTVVVADAYPNFSICGIPYYDAAAEDARQGKPRPFLPRCGGGAAEKHCAPNGHAACRDRAGYLIHFVVSGLPCFSHRLGVHQQRRNRLAVTTVLRSYRGWGRGIAGYSLSAVPCSGPAGWRGGARGLCPTAG